ncbi:energy-coupling factor ABC transporter ATP-binding protein [Anaerobium acetethylicum]|uniref:Cobalt/nickel transport system ATP-binding protein n=1 Tax=Anaerobium acetethylicum TaxID=1619234 RepID=A0A1D3TU09_9FIRM|nr:ABC transporter ATP-binding protein [Anaerobium acetethylicum]SCP97511.1 cobalt/nickel transport system ATP-binding protein [Anaerobium acetethylicum]
MLKIESISVTYPDGHKVLEHLDFHIEKGETVGIVGTNGAGKSTLLMSVVGILIPEEGRILVEGTEVCKKNLSEIRRRAGVVFQNPDDQLFMSNVYDDIAFGLRNYGDSEETVREKISGIAGVLGIEKLLQSHSHKLSGGEKRIAALASILVMEPSLVLFDEPTSFLDPKTRRKLMNFLKGLEVTKLIATHDLDMALEICDRVLVLKDGAVFAEGRAREILADEKLMDAAGLELPFCMQGIE